MSVTTVVTPSTEAFYWVTILVAQTPGTALGDFAADSGGLGFGGGTALFGSAILLIAGLYYATDVSRTVLS